MYRRHMTYRCLWGAENGRKAAQYRTYCGCPLTVCTKITDSYASYEHGRGVEVIGTGSEVPIWLLWFGFVNYWWHVGVVPAGTICTYRCTTNKNCYSEAFTSDLTPKRHQTNTVVVCVTVRISIGVLCTVALMHLWSPTTSSRGRSGVKYFGVFRGLR